MIAASLIALALVQADPSLSVLPAAATQTAPTTSASAPSPAPPADPDSDIPKGAPADDYGLVAWCRGALTGHMALYALVQPELRSIEQPGEVEQDQKDDHEQMQAGQDYLALYKHAMDAAEAASQRPIHDRGLTVEGQGEAIWTAAKLATPRTRMWSWLLWDLPGRCEVAAKRLQLRSGLLGQALRDTSAPDPSGAPAGSAPATIDDALKTGPTPQASPSGAPAPTPPASPPAPVLRGPE